MAGCGEGSAKGRGCGRFPPFIACCPSANWANCCDTLAAPGLTHVKASGSAWCCCDCCWLCATTAACCSFFCAKSTCNSPCVFRCFCCCKCCCFCCCECGCKGWPLTAPPIGCCPQPCSSPPGPCCPCNCCWLCVAAALCCEKEVASCFSLCCCSCGLWYASPYTLCSAVEGGDWLSCWAGFWALDPVPGCALDPAPGCTLGPTPG